MFCPICKTEYRPGFAKCADCGVALVERVSEEDSHADVPTRADGLELLWSGASQVLAEQIDDALDAAHIFHRLTKQEFGLMANLAQNVYFLWIDPRDRGASRSMAAKILSGTEQIERDSEWYPLDSGAVDPFRFGRHAQLQMAPGQDAPVDNAPVGSNEWAASDGPDGPLPDDDIGDFDPD